MPPTKRPRLGRPIPEPANFQPTAVWTEGPYLFRYDAKQGICRRSPVSASAATGTMYFRALPPQASKPKVILRRPPRLIMAGLYTVLAAAAMVFVFPLWPAAIYQLHQLHPSQPLSLTAPSQGVGKSAAIDTADVVPITDNRVIIPKIGVNTPIIEGSDLKVLDQHEGVWHQTGSLSAGNFVLAGHRFRYLPPNTSTLYNLNKLAPGDAIAVDWLGKRTVYQVKQLEIVPQNDIALLNPTTQPQLTIYSCNDWRQTQRVVAIATPLDKP